MDTIHISFDKCYQLFVQSADSSQDEAFVINAIAAIESCIERVICADIYSKSEGLEEYSTQSLKERNNSNSDDKRATKIAKYKRDKEIKERMQSLQRLLNKKNAEGDLDCEEESRSLMILQLESYCTDALDELDLIKQEIVLLEHMESMREEQNNSRNRSEDRGESSRGTGSRDGSGAVRGPGESNSNSSSARSGGRREGLPESREERVSSVFRPSLSAPTMTLEEFGDQQKAEAEERSRKESAQESHVVRRYAQLLADGDEDDADLLDKATMQDRDWDAWKEDNKKGSGNKIGKRF